MKSPKDKLAKPKKSSTAVAKRPRMVLTTAADLGVRMTAPPWEGALPTFWIREHSVTRTDHNEALRTLPYATRGRDHETAHIALKLQELPASIVLIMGAPGAGKTALLENLILYQRAKGTTVRRLTAASFDTNITLANAIRGIADPEQGKPKSTQRSVEAEAQGGLVGTHVRGAVSKDENIEIDTSAAWFQAIMQAGAESGPAGTLLTLDEAQDLGRKQRDTPEWHRVQQFLQVMNATILASGLDEPPKIALVAAGLLNCNRLLNAYGMSRIENHGIVRMGPLSERAMRQILIDHLTAQTTTGDPLPRPDEPTLALLIEEAGGNARHTASAGQAVQSVALTVLQERRSSWNSDDRKEVLRLSRDSRLGLYNNRIGANLSETETFASQVLAQATEAWGPQLPVEETKALLNDIGKQRGIAEGDILKGLLARGVLEQREPGDIFPTLSKQCVTRRHITFSIHSMAAHLNGQTSEGPKAGDRIAANARLIEQHLGQPEPKYIVPAWEWDDRQKISTLEALPEVFPALSAPVGGRKRTLAGQAAKVKAAVKKEVKRKDKDSKS